MENKRINLVKPITDTIPEYFAGKNLFVTGFTGFLGKYHLAKLLTDCPDVGKIYVLMRSSAKKSAQKRFDDTLENVIYDELKKSSPDQLKKIIPIEGDLMMPDLGISEENRKLLINEVSIVYHIAATVRFDIPLTDAILLNVRGTRDLCYLVLEMKKSITFVHISTAFSQLENKVVEEKLYPAPVNWRHAIEIAEKMDKFTASILCKKYSNGHPNTYTFTKAIAEEVVSDLCGKKIPCIIFRPTIVSSCIDGLRPGWVDNFNGPTGLFVAHAKGVLRTVFGDLDSCYDVVPVDYVINQLIKATWIQQYLRKDEVAVYNCSKYGYEKLTLAEMMESGTIALESTTLNPIWHVAYNNTGNWLVYFLNTILFHVLPGVFIDIILRISGNKPMYVTLQRRVYIANIALHHFTTNEWDFLNYNCEALDDYLQPSDQQVFLVDLNALTNDEYIVISSHYIQKYKLKEKDWTLEEIKRKQLMFAIIHNTLKYAALFMLSMWFLDAAVLPFMDYMNDYWRRL